MELEKIVNIEFFNLETIVYAGNVLKGSVKINDPDPELNYTLEVILKGRERIKLRSFDEDNQVCSDFTENIEICNEKLIKPLNFLDSSSSTVDFALETKEKYPGSFNLKHLNDTATISYKLLGILYSNNQKISSTKTWIQIIQYKSFKSPQDHALILKKCCCKYGTINISYNLNKANWSIKENFNIDIYIDNHLSKANIIASVHELWQKISYKDTKNHFESFTKLIFRENNKLSIASGQSFLTGNVLNIKIPLLELTELFNENYSTTSDFINCEYYLKVIFTSKAYFYKFESYFFIPFTIIH
jgi:Arrestin (or S-antigen), C-terminal domain